MSTEQKHDDALPVWLAYEHGQVFTIEEIEAASVAEIKAGNVERVAKGWEPIVEEPFAGSERWAAFKGRMMPGDEVQWFIHGEGRAARLGFVLMRPGASLATPGSSKHPAAHYIVAMS